MSTQIKSPARAARQEEPLLLRVELVAQLLSVSRATCYRMVENGELPSVRMAERVVRVPRRALDEWVAAKTTLAAVRGASDGARAGVL